jgi:hypothetical protein
VVDFFIKRKGALVLSTRVQFLVVAPGLPPFEYVGEKFSPLKKDFLIKLVLRLTPTRKCNSERQIQLCLAYTVAASLMLQLPSSIIKCISERHS